MELPDVSNAPSIEMVMKVLLARLLMSFIPFRSFTSRDTAQSVCKASMAIGVPPVSVTDMEVLVASDCRVNALKSNLNGCMGSSNVRCSIPRFKSSVKLNRLGDPVSAVYTSAWLGSRCVTAVFGRVRRSEKVAPLIKMYDVFISETNPSSIMALIDARSKAESITSLTAAYIFGDMMVLFVRV